VARQRTEKDPCDSHVGEEAEGQLDVANGQLLELEQMVAAGAVDGQQDGPGDDASDQTYNRQHAEEAQKEKGIERAVVEDVIVGDGEEGADPVEPAGGQRGRRVPASGSVSVSGMQCTGYTQHTAHSTQSTAVKWSRVAPDSSLLARTLAGARWTGSGGRRRGGISGARRGI
jgi:hypothetical protein